MNPNDLEDAQLAATIARNTQQFFREKFATSNKRDLGGILPDPSNQVDPKRIIMRDWKQYAEQINRPTQPANQQVVPYGHGLPDPNKIGSAPLLPVPVGIDEHGNLVTQSPLANLQQQTPAQQYQPVQTERSTFQLPTFGSPVTSAPNNPATDIDSKFDILIKEIKTLRKAINKLTRDFEKSIVASQPITSNPIETDIKSQNLSE